MNMKIDEYTGEKYDADKWYRGPLGIWIDREAERKQREILAKAENKRRSVRNLNRVLRGKRPKSHREFERSASRYDEWLHEDSGMRFGEWLKERYGKRCF